MFIKADKDQTPAICTQINNSKIASYEQLDDAQKAGAQWCIAGFTDQDGEKTGSYNPMQKEMQGCGLGNAVNYVNKQEANANGVLCYGKKPTKQKYGKYTITPWYQPVTNDDKSQWSINSVDACPPPCEECPPCKECPPPCKECQKCKECPKSYFMIILAIFILIILLGIVFFLYKYKPRK